MELRGCGDQVVGAVGREGRRSSSGAARRRAARRAGAAGAPVLVDGDLNLNSPGVRGPNWTHGSYLVAKR